MILRVGDYQSVSGGFDPFEFILDHNALLLDLFDSIKGINMHRTMLESIEFCLCLHILTIAIPH